MADSDAASPASNAASLVLVWDAQQVARFLALFLPDSPQLVMEVSVMARRKYAPTLCAARQMLERIFINGATTDTGPLSDTIASAVRRVQRLQAPFGSYVDKDLKPIPQHALLVYANVQPRSPTLAMAQTLLNLTRRSECHDHCKATERPLKMLWKQLGQATVPCGLRHMDIDTKDADKLLQVHELLTTHGALGALRAKVETMHGYHVVYDAHAMSDPTQRALHDLQVASGPADNTRWFSISRSGNIALPGTIQGGTWNVRFADELWA